MESLQISIPAERLEAIARDVIAQALPVEEVRRIRRELLLTVMTITSEEGGILLGVTARHFRELCDRVGVPVEALGHKTPRYRVLALSEKLDALSIAAKREKDALKGKLLNLAAESLNAIEALKWAA